MPTIRTNDRVSIVPTVLREPYAVVLQNSHTHWWCVAINSKYSIVLYISYVISYRNNPAFGIFLNRPFDNESYCNINRTSYLSGYGLPTVHCRHIESMARLAVL